MRQPRTMQLNHEMSLRYLDIDSEHSYGSNITLLVEVSDDLIEAIKADTAVSDPALSMKAEAFIRAYGGDKERSIAMVESVLS